jgi:putative redox protein
MKKVTVSLVPGTKFQHQISNGTNSVTTDVDVASGGSGTALDPKELALGALGGCIGMTLVLVAQRKKWDLQHISVTVTQTDEPDPANPGKTRMVVTEDIEVTGKMTPKQLDELKKAAQKCPVYKLMTEPKRMAASVKLITPPATSGSSSSNASTAGRQQPTRRDGPEEDSSAH